LVRSLVEMHGGTVTAHSEGFGKGRAFLRFAVSDDGDVCGAIPPERDGSMARRRTGGR
jgi:hypothetical protein